MDDVGVKEVKEKVAKISLRQEIEGTIFEGILSITEDDIEAARLELESCNTIRSREINVGIMNEREVRVIAYVFKAKKCLNKLMIETEGPVTNEKNDWSLLDKLGKDIKFAKSWLHYLITSRCKIPQNTSLIFKKGFQVVFRHEEANTFFEQIDE